MSLSKSVPDSWDDDWVANQSEVSDTSEHTERTRKPSKAERRRRQLELNRKLWQEAEAPGSPYLVQRSNEVPLQSGFTPSVKVLSRRPTPANTSRDNLKTNLDQVNFDNHEEEAEESERKEPTPEERTEKLRKELEEKQKKYDEVRKKIFGSASNSAPVESSWGGNGRGRGFSHTGSFVTGKQRSRGRGELAGRGSLSRQLFDPHAPKRGSIPSSGGNTPTETSRRRVQRGQDVGGNGNQGLFNQDEPVFSEQD